MKLIHVGYPKSASSFLQLEVFSKDERLNFLGIIRDHDGVNNIDVENHKFRKSKELLHFLRGKTKDVDPDISADLFSSEKIHVLSDEDLSTADNISVDEKVLRLVSTIPDAKILVVLRSPEDFLKSFYRFYFRGGKFVCTLNEWFESEYNDLENSVVLNTAFYERYLRSLCEAFGRKNLLVLDYSMLKRDPHSFFSLLYDFLGISMKLPQYLNQRNKALPGSALKFGIRFPRVWEFRRYIPARLRQLIKNNIFSLIKAKDEDFNEKNIEIIKNIYMKDLAFVEREFGVNLR